MHEFRVLFRRLPVAVCRNVHRHFGWIGFLSRALPSFGEPAKEGSLTFGFQSAARRMQMQVALYRTRSLVGYGTL